MRYGVVILPEHRWRRTQEVWRQAEELGFDHAWTYDHAVWRWLSDDPWYSSVGTLTAAALATSRLRIGTMVANPALRHPVIWAKDAMTIDELSDGRMTFGVGAGGYDADLLEGRLRNGGALLPSNRTERLREFVELTDALLCQRPTSYEGSHYQCHGVVLQPPSAQQPRVPIAIAAAGPRGMRLAAEYADSWVTSGAPNSFELRGWKHSVPAVRAQVDALCRACDGVGRDPSTLGRTLLTGASIDGVLESVAAVEDATAAYAEAGITDLVVHWPRPQPPFAASMATFERIAASIRQSRSPSMKE